MRIVVLSPDIPFPANRGGRADVWRRVQAMAVLGHEVMLVAPTESGKSILGVETDVAFKDIVRIKFFYVIKRSFSLTFSRLLRSFWVPWHASTRIPDIDTLTRLSESVRDFQPDALWLDGPWLGIVAQYLAERFQVPILYRSHNIEFNYMRGQACLAVRPRDRLALGLACIGLKRFENMLIRQASSVFDISVDDLLYWKSSGIQNIHWLPPLPELAFRERPSSINPSDLLFIGNLATPNNVRGVAWLLTEVLPRVRTHFPSITCRVVGSNPTPFISQLLEATPGVELCANVVDTMPYLFGAKVLVNPVMSGSGIQVKMLDMLMTDAPIVTASQGTRGLPNDFKGLFRIADDPDLFAQAVREEFSLSSVDIARRIAAREVFSVAAVGQALDLSLAERDLNA